MGLCQYRRTGRWRHAHRVLAGGANAGVGSVIAVTAAVAFRASRLDFGAAPGGDRASRGRVWRPRASRGGAHRAIRVARSRAAEWGIDPGRIGILGFSAGGHLAVSAGVLHAEQCYEPVDAADEASPRPDFVVGCYPVVSFGPVGHSGSMVNLLGENPDRRQRRRLSLEESVDARTSPAFLWHTADDEGVAVENSLLLATALRWHRVPFELHVFPHGRHGLGLAPDRPDVAAWTELCARWILTQGRETA